MSLSGNLGMLIASVSLATDDTSTLASARGKLLKFITASQQYFSLGEGGGGGGTTCPSSSSSKVFFFTFFHEAGSDYLMLPSTNLIFSNGTRSNKFTIAIISDTIPEQAETIVVNITSITISRNGTHISLSSQEKNRIKILSDYVRVIIYDNIHCSEL